MKRTIRLIILFVFALTLIALPVNAQEHAQTEDSIHVDNQVRRELNLKHTDEIFRIYNIVLLSAFAESNNLDEVLSSNELLQICYAVKAEDGSWSYYSYSDSDNKYYAFNVVKLINRHAFSVFLDGDVVKYVAPDIEVYNTYYLSGETCHLGTAIYYITNKGDYVYFTEGGVGENLFPAEAFFAYQKAVFDDISRNPSYSGPSYDIWDLSPYKFGSDTFDLNAKYPGQITEEDIQNLVKDIVFWIIAPVGICLLAAGTVIGIRHLRKKKMV